MDEASRKDKKFTRNLRRRLQMGEKSIANLTDAEWAMVLAGEEDSRQSDPLYQKCDPIFSTFIEKRMDYPKSIGLACLGVPPNKKIKIWDVYISIDSYYRTIGHYLTLLDAEGAACTARLRLERILKNNLKRIIGSTGDLDSHA